MNKKGIDELKREYEEVSVPNGGLDGYKDAIRRAKEDNRSQRRKVVRAWKIAATSAAAIVIAFIILPNASPQAAHAMGKIPVIGTVVKAVTFRDYQYEDETQIADIEVPKLVTADITENEEAAYDGGATSPTAYTLQGSVEEINGEIQELAQRIIEDFQADVEQREGYKEVIVSHEVICSTEQYFTLKLMHYEGEGSGTQWNYYYTIDLATGERMELKDLFAEDEDYIGIISNEIKKQMQERMENDEDKYYWLNDEIEELNFKEITPDTQFYINESNNLVIIFNEGDVAPAYMGSVSFEIPSELLKDIRK